VTAIKNVCEGDVQGVPDILRPGQAPPTGTKMQLIIQPTGPGKVSILKHYTFPKQMPSRAVIAMCKGVGYTFPLSKNTWGLKKAYHALFNRIPGEHFMYSVLKSKTMVKGKSNEWSPSDDEISEALILSTRAVRPEFHQMKSLSGW
jgi:hypothetical protein